MKGDFSFGGIAPDAPYTGVRHQQGRVLLDRDWNDAQEMDALWRRRVAGDSFGMGLLAVPVANADAFQVTMATADASGVHVTLEPGRAWASGVPITLPAEATLEATYVEPPLAPAVDASSIAAGVRDAVLLEVFEDSVSGFQDPSALIEPALGGQDTTMRVQSFARVRLLRLGPNEDCSAVAGLVDDPATRGKLSVSPSPALVIAGDCPLEAGGGYTGLEHYLFRFEIATPTTAGAARFKWSRFNGGLVGRGIFGAGAPGTGVLTLTANDQAVNTCGLSRFYLEALQFDATQGLWVVSFTADAQRLVDGVLNLSNIVGVWPAAAGATGFFRLWDGIGEISRFAGAQPVDFMLGVQLKFDPPAPGNTNYRPGDYWTVPVRASGAAFDPPVWPLDAPPFGVTRWRVPIAEITWQAAATGFDARFDRGDVEDCREPVRPLTRQKICCSYVVGDGRSSFGDFNSIELALQHLPAAGGEICLLPGLHTTNAQIRNRRNVTIRGCGARTRVLPRAETPDAPIITILDSTRIAVEHIDFVSLGGAAVWIEGTKPGACDDLLVTRHRILACTHAVFAHGASQLEISHNRIRMFDRPEGRPAIDVAGQDLLIERNDIRLIPAEQTPPVDPENPEDPIDPVDPCLRLVRLYRVPRVFTQFVDRVWTLVFPIDVLLGLKRPWQAPGGIRLRGACERVRVLENRVEGGAGHGVTLGGQYEAVPQPPPPAPHRFRVTTPDALVRGRVLGPGGEPLAGIQITVTRDQDGSQRTEVSQSPGGDFSMGISAGDYELTEGAPGLEIDKLDVGPSDANNVVRMTVVLKASVVPPDPQAETGFLYDIAIDRNDIRFMGLCGIGVPLPDTAILAIARARNQLGWPVIHLEIRDNRLQHNLRNPFDASLRAVVQTRGLGGISLGLVDRLHITGNRIEGHGRSGADPVCGIFLQYGESVEIAHNVVLDNGSVPLRATVQDGQRGGVVLALVASFGLFAKLTQREEAMASAARVIANHVEQPVGQALRARVFGALTATDNVLASQRADVVGLEALVATVLITDLAGVQNAALPVRIAGAPLAEEAEAETFQPVGALAVAAAVAGRAVIQLPLGAVMFHDNQIRAAAGHLSPVTQLLVAYDDLGFEGNQCQSEQTARLFVNTALQARSLRALGNRLQEPRAQTTLSLLTLASHANNTSFNQADHCIVAQDTDPNPPATVQVGNQVLLPNLPCSRFNMIVALLFKPLHT